MTPTDALIEKMARATKLRRFCVTVSDNWTPMRTFFTLGAAKRFYLRREDYSNVFHWHAGEWKWVFGARDRNP